MKEEGMPAVILPLDQEAAGPQDQRPGSGTADTDYFMRLLSYVPGAELKKKKN